jgi:hypothetical protein
LYENNTFSLFSVFGSVYYESKDYLHLSINEPLINPVKSIEFGNEGYSLWAYIENNNEELHHHGNFIKLKLLKASILNNPSMSNTEHATLNGEREVYVCLNLSKFNSYNNTISNKTSSYQ